MQVEPLEIVWSQKLGPGLPIIPSRRAERVSIVEGIKKDAKELPCRRISGFIERGLDSWIAGILDTRVEGINRIIAEFQ